MYETRDDPARSMRGTPQPDAVRWFFVYTSWQDIKGAPTDTTNIDQSCQARHAFWHHVRKEWIGGGQFVTLYDPKRASKSGVGTLVRAAFNPVNQHWEVFQPLGQGYLEYTLDKALTGFAAAIPSNLVLDGSNLTGWTGSTQRAGSESEVGIEYQAAETAPQTNGLYRATKDGLFRITLQGYWQLTGQTEPGKALQENIESGPASAGTAHTHFVHQTGHDQYLLGAGPRLQIDLYNKKASGGAIAIAADAGGRFFRWQHHLVTTLSSRTIPVSAQWNICLHQNDRIALKWTASSMVNHEWSRKDDPIKLRFDYLGAIQEWELI